MPVGPVGGTSAEPVPALAFAPGSGFIEPALPRVLPTAEEEPPCTMTGVAEAV